MSVSRLVILIDDLSPGFWGRDVPPDRSGCHFEPIARFDSEPDEVCSLNLRLAEVGCDPKAFDEVFVVTDGDLGHGIDGGASLLGQIQAISGWKWMRAVIYSGDPALDGLSGRLRDDVWAVKRRDFQKDVDKLLAFLTFGIKRSTESFVELVGEVGEIAQMVRTVQVSPKGHIETHLPPLFGNWVRSRRRRIWTLDATADLGEALHGEFSTLLMATAWQLLGKSRKENGDTEVKALHELVVQLLDPIKSLGEELTPTGSPIRRLWELMASRVTPTPIPCELLGDRRIGARGRCWVQGRIESLIRACDTDRLAEEALNACDQLIAIARELNHHAKQEKDGV